MQILVFKDGEVNQYEVYIEVVKELSAQGCIVVSIGGIKPLQYKNGSWYGINNITIDNNDDRVLRRAKELYHDHNKITCTTDFMWDKCSKEYKESWITIAKADFM